MPNLTPTLIATINNFGKKKPVSRVILNPMDSALLKTGSNFTNELPSGSLIGSAVGVLNGQTLVLEWNLISQGYVSILEGGAIGMYGPLDGLQPDPNYITPILYGKEPLYELGEDVAVTSGLKAGRWGSICGVLKVDLYKESRLSTLRTHHLNVIEGPMPPDILLQVSGIHYWISSVETWIPEGFINPVATQSLPNGASPSQSGLT
jgi:hypothetical protein